MIAEDVAWALETLAHRRRFYRLYLAYYHGHHRMAFVTERMRDAFGELFRAFALNLCGVVVETVNDRLRVVGWSGPDGSGDAPADVQAVWERNLMASRQGQVHREALAAGDAYVHVWQDPDGLVRIYDESPLCMIGRPDPLRPGMLAYAVRVWLERKRVRVTVYYPDRIERYATRSEQVEVRDPRQLVPLEPAHVPEGEDAQPVVVNPWDEVPVVHFPRAPDSTGLGVSILRDAVPPQDWLNKTVADLLAAQEVEALPLRALIGYEPEHNPDGTVRPLFNERRDRVFTLPKGASVWESSGGDPSPLLRIKSEAAADVARVTRIPIHKLMLVGANDWPSGEALRVAEADLVAQAADLAGAWGPRWVRVVTLATRMRQADEAEVRALWAPHHTPPTDLEAAMAAEAKQRAGIPPEQTWREMGYSDEQVADFSRALAQRQDEQAEREARAFSAGTAGGGF
jgi:hypothetical protein